MSLGRLYVDAPVYGLRIADRVGGMARTELNCSGGRIRYLSSGHARRTLPDAVHSTEWYKLGARPQVPVHDGTATP